MLAEGASKGEMQTTDTGEPCGSQNKEKESKCDPSN